MMPQTGDQLELPLLAPCTDVTESNQRLLKPPSSLQKSPHQKNDVPSENGSMTCGVSRVHSNGHVITAIGGMQSHAKSHCNGYVCGQLIVG